MIQKKLIGKIWIFEDFFFCGLIDFRQLNRRKPIETNEMLQEVWFFLLNYHFQSINGDECAKIKKCKQSRIPIIRRIKIRKFYIKTKFNRTNDSLFSFWIIYFLPNFLTFVYIQWTFYELVRSDKEIDLRKIILFVDTISE